MRILSYTSKDLFLSNTKNKAKFIKLLGKALQSDGCEVYHARGDADLLICKKAIEKSTDRTVSLVGDDTDLLVLLLHHARSKENDIIITPHKNSKKSRNWSIVNAISQLPSHISENIFFIHALLGTDTTSRIQGMGKGIGLKKIQQSSDFLSLAQTFQKKNMSRETIMAAGEQAVLIIYNAKDERSLDELRYTKFMEKVAVTLHQVVPSTLPPTSSSAKYHSLRVYLQVQQWIDPECDLSPEDWGWKLVDGRFSPIEMDIPPAPSDLLKNI